MLVLYKYLCLLVCSLITVAATSELRELHCIPVFGFAIPVSMLRCASRAAAVFRLHSYQRLLILTSAQDRQSLHTVRPWVDKDSASRSESRLSRRIAPKLLSTHETIYALSSAPGKAGIAVIRVSGPACLDVRTSIFRPEIGLTFCRFTKGYVLQIPYQNLDMLPSGPSLSLGVTWE